MPVGHKLRLVAHNRLRQQLLLRGILGEIVPSLSGAAWAARRSASAALASAVAARCSAAARTASTSASVWQSGRSACRSAPAAPCPGADPVGFGAQRPQQLRAAHLRHRHRAGVIGRADRGAVLLGVQPLALPSRPMRGCGLVRRSTLAVVRVSRPGRRAGHIRGNRTSAAPWWSSCWSSALP